ncbi:hypothetical protein Mapa_015955 [Marchantia paleacea]|nr:hypothetical protein Mapa_015955 [Marchantia paleacea]
MFGVSDVDGMDSMIALEVEKDVQSPLVLKNLIDTENLPKSDDDAPITAQAMSKKQTIAAKKWRALQNLPANTDHNMVGSSSFNRSRIWLNMRRNVP